MKIELHTPRLLLRTYIADDIPELIALIGAREIAETTLRIPHPYTHADAEDQVRRSQGSEDAVRLGVWVKASSTFVGGVGLRLEVEHHRAELGYWIGVPYWGNGYATEAARALLQYAFDELKLNRVYASHVPNNPASGKILLKLGMRQEGYLRGHILKWNEYQDLVLYGMVKEDLKTVGV
jgi:[ribosomal protein S5]-alanine N-acetyltransferase